MLVSYRSNSPIMSTQSWAQPKSSSLVFENDSLYQAHEWPKMWRILMCIFIWYILPVQHINSTPGAMTYFMAHQTKSFEWIQESDARTVSKITLQQSQTVRLNLSSGVCKETSSPGEQINHKMEITPFPIPKHRVKKTHLVLLLMWHVQQDGGQDLQASWDGKTPVEVIPQSFSISIPMNDKYVQNVQEIESRTWKSIQQERLTCFRHAWPGGGGMLCYARLWRVYM